MKALSDIQTDLSLTLASIERLEALAAKHRDEQALFANIRSLRKRQSALEAEFMTVASARHVDVCSYRLFTEDAPATVRGLSEILGAFQRTFSVVYDCLIAGRKARARIGVEALNRTTLGFGYTFPGSLGVVMTLPEEMLFFGDEGVDLAMRITLSMTKAETADQLSPFVERLGPAPLGPLFEWATAHVAWGHGASIDWHSISTPKAHLLIQTSELRALRTTIASTDQELIEEFETAGELVGIDTVRRNFRIRLPGGHYIKGAIADTVALATDHTVELPRSYRFRVRKITRTSPATETVDEEFLLLELTQS